MINWLVCAVVFIWMCFHFDDRGVRTVRISRKRANFFSLITSNQSAQEMPENSSRSWFMVAGMEGYTRHSKITFHVQSVSLQSFKISANSFTSHSQQQQQLQSCTVINVCSTQFLVRSVCWYSINSQLIFAIFRAPHFQSIYSSTFQRSPWSASSVATSHYLPSVNCPPGWIASPINCWLP